jgi:ribose transport system substrate-binding protein
LAKGIPVITVDSDAPASKRLTFIGTDNYKAGLMGAQLAVKQLQGKGNVVVFTMPEQANLKERLRGYHDGFEGHPGIKIVETVDIKGDARIAFDHTQDLVDKKGMDKIDGFICLEAIACPEVADVLDRNKVGGKVIVAMDTDPRTLDCDQEGPHRRHYRAEAFHHGVRGRAGAGYAAPLSAESAGQAVGPRSAIASGDVHWHRRDAGG